MINFQSHDVGGNQLRNNSNDNTKHFKSCLRYCICDSRLFSLREHFFQNNTTAIVRIIHLPNIPYDRVLIEIKTIHGL